MTSNNTFEDAAQALGKVHDLVLDGQSIQENLEESRGQWKAACEAWASLSEENSKQVAELLDAQKSHEQTMRDVVSETKAILAQQGQDFASLRSDALKAQSEALKLGERAFERSAAVIRTQKYVIAALVLLVVLCTIVIYLLLREA
jgi:hypothetical protein